MMYRTRFEDRWDHRAPSSSTLYLSRTYGDLLNRSRPLGDHKLPTIFIPQK
jgi:hypothetical protein